MTLNRLPILAGIAICLLMADKLAGAAENSDSKTAWGVPSFSCVWRGEFVSKSVSVHLVPSAYDGKLTGIIVWQNGQEATFSGTVQGRKLPFQSTKGHGILEMAPGDQELHGWIDLPNSGRCVLHLKRKK